MPWDDECTFLWPMSHSSGEPENVVQAPFDEIWGYPMFWQTQLSQLHKLFSRCPGFSSQFRPRRLWWLVQWCLCGSSWWRKLPLGARGGNGLANGCQIYSWGIFHVYTCFFAGKSILHYYTKIYIQLSKTQDFLLGSPQQMMFSARKTIQLYIAARFSSQPYSIGLQSLNGSSNHIHLKH